MGWAVAQAVASNSSRAVPDSSDIPNDLVPSIEGSMSRVAERGENYTTQALQEWVEALRSEFEEDLSDNRWMSRFPGRAVLNEILSATDEGI